jgi:hypothetical protein
MLSQTEACRLAGLLSRLVELLPRASRIAVARQMNTALGAVNACVEGRALDRQAVITALMFLELEMRTLLRVNQAGEANSGECERLWGEIESITGDL